MRRLLPVLLLLASPVFAQAGTIPLAWDPVTDTDLAGYRVFYGTASGTYTSQADVPVATSYALGGLADCTTYYIAVKARDAAGNLSAAFSNELAGYPSMTFTVPATTWNVGTTGNLTLAGTNFRTGATAVLLPPTSGASIPCTVNVASCTAATVTCPIPSGAATGARVLRVRNSDGTFREAGGVSIGDAAPAGVTGLRRTDTVAP